MPQERTELLLCYSVQQTNGGREMHRKTQTEREGGGGRREGRAHRKMKMFSNSNATGEWEGGREGGRGPTGKTAHCHFRSMHGCANCASEWGGGREREAAWISPWWHARRTVKFGHLNRTSLGEEELYYARAAFRASVSSSRNCYCKCKVSSHYDKSRGL